MRARVARGEFVAFLDSDDVWLPGKLDAELQCLQSVFRKPRFCPTVKTFSKAWRMARVALRKMDCSQRQAVRFAGRGLRLAMDQQHEHCSHLFGHRASRRVAAHRFDSCLRKTSTVVRIGSFRCAFVTTAASWCCRKSGRTYVVSTITRETGRGIPGQTDNAEQEMILLRSRLTVMKRATWLKDLDARLAAELERFRKNRTDLHGLTLK